MYVAQTRSPVLLKGRNEILQLDCTFRGGAEIYDDVFNIFGIFSHSEDGYAYVFYDDDPVGDGEVLTKRSPEHLVPLEDYKVRSNALTYQLCPNILSVCVCPHSATWSR